MDLYKLENEALGKSVARLSSDQEALAKQVASLENENRVLKDVVTGKTAIESLAETVRRVEEARQQEHETMLTLIRDILSQLKDMWRQSRSRPGGDPGAGEIGRRQLGREEDG